MERGQPEAGAQAAALSANERFYAAFEAADLDAMSDLWEHSDRAVCTHPGWATLHGWAAVSASWYALFTGADRLQIIVTGARAAVDGDVAWVSCDENLLGGSGAGSTVAALNLFVRSASGAWSMVAHHGSPVAPR